MNWVQYKKHKNLQSTSSKVPFNIHPLLKYYISLIGLPGLQYIPVIIEN
jgi:hypothetical protein